MVHSHKFREQTWRFAEWSGKKQGGVYPSLQDNRNGEKMERTTGFEPATLGLGSRCSTG